MYPLPDGVVPGYVQLRDGRQVADLLALWGWVGLTHDMGLAVDSDIEDGCRAATVYFPSAAAMAAAYYRRATERRYVNHSSRKGSDMADGNQHPLYYIILEQEARRRRTTRLEIIDGTGTSGIGAPGSLAAFVARKGSGALEDVRRAARGDRASIDRLMAKYGSGPVRPEPLSETVYAQMVVDSDVFANIRYGGTDLSKGILLHRGVDLVAFSFPYNGGRLDADGLTLVEFVRDDCADELEGVVVQISPPLTAAEQAALEALNDEELVQNVGADLSCGQTTYFVVGAAALFVMAGTAIVGVAVLVAVKPEDDATHLTDEQVRDLDPSASARELLAIRRRLLLEQRGRRS